MAEQTEPAGRSATRAIARFATAAMAVATVSVVGVGAAAAVEPDECATVPGSALVAKFEVVGGAYVFEKPAGNESVVTLLGATLSGGSWASTAWIGGVVVKGGTGSTTSLLSPSTKAGTFSNAGLTVGTNANTPDISHIVFCSGPAPVAPPPSPSCSTVADPSGLIAKFEVVGGAYVFEKPAGNGSVVTLTGTSLSGGSWTSTVGVGSVVVKGGTGTTTSVVNNATSGTFSNVGLTVGQNGNTPDISNIQFFCGAQGPSGGTGTGGTGGSGSGGGWVRPAPTCHLLWSCKPVVKPLPKPAPKPVPVPAPVTKPKPSPKPSGHTCPGLWGIGRFR